MPNIGEGEFAARVAGAVVEEGPGFNPLDLLGAPRSVEQALSKAGATVSGMDDSLSKAKISGYSGRITSQYDAETGVYSEHYAPPRQTAVGEVGSLHRVPAGDGYIDKLQDWRGVSFYKSDESTELPAGVVPMLLDPAEERSYVERVIDDPATRRVGTLGDSSRIGAAQFDDQDGSVAYRLPNGSTMSIRYA